MNSVKHLIAVAVPSIAFAQSSPRDTDSKCQSSIATALENPFGVLSHYRMRLPDAKFSGLFSKQIKGCVAAVMHRPDNQWAIVDPDNRFLGTHFTLFTCDSGGVNNVILEKAKKYKGRNFHKHYRAFLDDGKGGVAKRLRRSSTRYSVQDCQNAFNKKVRELRTGLQ